MALVQSGDADAFAELYHRYSGSAHGLADAICHHAPAAEDAVQEAFVSIWRNRSRYQPRRGAVGAWVLAIVRNRAIDATRHHAKHSRRREDATPLEYHPAAADVDGETQAADEGRRLRALLVALPAAQREVITLAFYGELSHSEIATHLRLPAGTVKGRMRLGLRQLQTFR